MYCSSCGTTVTPGLSYCNRCGAELSPKKSSATTAADKSPEYLVWAIVAVSVGGLGVILALMAVMKQALHFNNELVVLFSLLSFLLLLGAESIFIWLLLRSQSYAKDSARQAAKETQLGEGSGRELGAARVLPEPGISVTEHTTRTLEPVYSERKTE